MRYSVEFSKTAKKQISKMDKVAATMILAWIRKNLEGCHDPRQHGKALTGEYRGYWRYRIGNYRIIADIQDEKVTILIMGAGHRKNIY